MIGQACSYKVGHRAWADARAEAQKTLGPKFDIKQFHEVLREGAMPLSILQRRIRERTAELLAGCGCRSAAEVGWTIGRCSPSLPPDLEIGRGFHALPACACDRHCRRFVTCGDRRRGCRSDE